MAIYQAPIVIEGFATINYPHGKGADDYTGALPRDAGAEVRATPPFLGGSQMFDYTVELNGAAQHVKRN